MAKVMKHSWVTKRGAWPLKSVREMLREGVSLDESEAELPDLMATFNVLDVPRQVRTQSMSNRWLRKLQTPPAREEEPASLQTHSCRHQLDAVSFGGISVLPENDVVVAEFLLAWLDAKNCILRMQDHLLEVLKPGLPERTFRDGEVLLRQGEQGTHLMYILQGQVEVLVKLPPIRESSRSAQSPHKMAGLLHSPDPACPNNCRTRTGQEEVKAACDRFWLCRNRSGNGGRAPKSGGSNDADTSRADIRTGSMDPLRSRATEMKTSSVPEVIGDDLPPALLEASAPAPWIPRSSCCNSRGTTAPS